MSPLFRLAAWAVSFETGSEGYLEVARDSHWIHSAFLFHAGVACSTLCSVADTPGRRDSSQPVHADMIMTSVAFSWLPVRHLALSGFHYGSMVSISFNFNSKG